MSDAAPNTTQIDKQTDRIEARRRLIEATREAAAWRAPRRRRKRTVSAV